MTAINPDEAPEAPSPRPPLQIFMRVTENRVADDYDGGLVLLQAIKGQVPEVAKRILDSRLVISAADDAFMATFPWKSRQAKQARFFRLTLEEIPVEQVPPDPNAEPELFNKDGVRVDRAGIPVPPVSA